MLIPLGMVYSLAAEGTRNWGPQSCNQLRILHGAISVLEANTSSGVHIVLPTNCVDSLTIFLQALN